MNYLSHYKLCYISLFFVVEINCGKPVLKAHATMLWDGTSHVGSIVYYGCEEGYHFRSQRNYSVCAVNGLWEDIDLCCEGATFDDTKNMIHWL